MAGSCDPPSPAPLKLYWIDPSCDEAAGGDFETLHVLEARHWAKRAYERLCSDTDTDFARVFNLIFKTPKTDTKFFPRPDNWQEVHGDHLDQWQTSSQHVLAVLYDFAHNWARTDNRQEADVRIYAGARGLSRWQPLLAGLDGSGNTHFDPINCLVASGVDRDNLQAFTAYFSTPTPVDENEHPLRGTIDLGPGAWAVPEPPQISVTSLSTLDPALLLSENNQDGAPVTITHLSRSLVTRLLLHEFMHVHGYLLDDSHDYDNEDGTAGWWFCMRRWKGEAAVCAEPVAMLGLWAALADMRPAGMARGGFTVERGWDEIPGGWEDVHPDGRDDDEAEEEGMKWDEDWMDGGNSALKGELRFYEDITN
ncbi:hypothetical protein C8A01DRAFT_31458 [Parachaetomium inaequale]|uniref:Uncharacterized protein n=1 Tax=Parachaetomium inaequale TaxID=2588326 RepID=A0AAN6SVA5_9PEZI|nr:hypothetical protein C8A01DRAFT_31458 [Parachaetomium inaequale]